uniref:Uncharacterized protein n=1 Tax=Gossypium raimondii TaxID=29730 RepID=A0A0D2VBA5_GOSRA|nr:hypothetical protein B456_013G091800 [Gossypium raimondii]
MSCYRLSISVLLFFLLLLLRPSAQTPSPRNHCPWQRSSCSQLRIHKFRHFLPPWPEQDEIDPRYGVEKRLVPSWPNPLHN